MANAFVLGFDNYFIQNNTLVIQFRAAYIGADIPGGSAGDSMQATIDPTLNASQINTAIADAVRSYAVAHGFTVPASSVIISSVSKG